MQSLERLEIVLKAPNVLQRLCAKFKAKQNADRFWIDSTEDEGYVWSFSSQSTVIVCGQISKPSSVAPDRQLQTPIALTPSSLKFQVLFHENSCVIDLSVIFTLPTLVDMPIYIRN